MEADEQGMLGSKFMAESFSRLDSAYTWGRNQCSLTVLCFFSGCASYGPIHLAPSPGVGWGGSVYRKSMVLVGDLGTGHTTDPHKSVMRGA